MVTTISSAPGSSWATESAMSPVPGGRSMSSTSRSPQYTSARNCCSARWSMGPRHTTGVLPLVNIPIEMTLHVMGDGRHDHLLDLGGPPVTPSMRGTECP